MSIWSAPTVAVLLAAIALPTGAVAENTADTVPTPVSDVAALVNPFLGTKAGAADFGHGGGAGMNFPGAVVPFGMMQWSPDTMENAGGGYAWEDNRLRGFSMTHISGPGCTGAQDFPVIPISGRIGRSPATNGSDYVQTFKHENEKAAPGYYSSVLDTGIKTELSASTRGGVARFGFPAGKPGTLLLNTSGSVNGVDDGETRISGDTVTGWVQTGGFCGPPMRYKVYFHATFDQPILGYGTWKDGTVTPGGAAVRNASKAKVANAEVVTPGDISVNGPGSGAYLEFDPARPVQMRVGLSYVSLAGAKANLAAEIGQDGVDQVAAKARALWNTRLGQVKVTGGTAEQQRTFYSNLYHALLQPYVFDDVDGAYTGMNGQTYKVTPGRHHYATFSGWDIYRSEVQLLALLAPDVASDIAQSMYANAQSVGNVWDRWSHQNAITGVMVGDPFHSILSSMYAFGARDFDAASALKAMAESARRVGPKDIGHPQLGYDQRPGNADFMAKGHVPMDVSTTLEYGIADFGIAQLAARLGNTTVASEFMKRAQAWQATYNPANTWIQPKMADGAFRSPFDPGTMNSYIEGNGAQYHWLVPHNVRGLFDSMGGDAAAAARLDGFFKVLNAGPNQPYAYLGNEPSAATPWLYAWAGQPYKTQDLVRRVQKELFSSAPDGLVGNDDLGAMASWYVWSAIGLFPAIPGRAELLVNTPLFDSITIKRPAGDLIVNAPNSANRYVKTLKVNGVATTKAWVPESIAQRGGRLDFTTSTVPNTAFGTAAADAPPAFNEGAKPVLLGLNPGSGPAEPGRTFETTITARSTSRSAASVRWEAKPPPGISVAPASGTLTPAAGAAASQRITVTVPAGTPLGMISIPIIGSGQVNAGIRVNVARPGTPAWHHNNASIGDDTKPGSANVDGANFSYSAQGLAAAGLTPGATVGWNGFTFTWPNRAPGEWDDILPGVKPLDVTAPTGATQIAFLGAGTGGYPEVDATLTYTDGTTTTARLGMSDWLLSYGGGSPQYGNQIIASSPYRLYGGSWAMQPIPAHVFAAQPIALNPAKKLKSITFGPSDNGALHLFTWAFR